MSQAGNRQRHSQRVAIILTALTGAIATAVAYLGTRESTQAPVSSPAAPAATSLPVETVALPHDEAELPFGPHQEIFVAACTICHSTRLVMTQPPLPQQQWVEVVHKMVKNYGAPITPESEGRIVEYLATVRSQ